MIKQYIQIKFVDTCRFMPSKLSSLFDNLSEINIKALKIAKHAWTEKRSDQNVSLLVLKILD